METDIRYVQRLQNFEHAFLLLKSALTRPSSDLSDLEKEGVIQRFEYTFELGWKTLKDYLDYHGVILDQITPRCVIKTAFASGIIKNGKEWMEMLEYRNLLSHTYDFKIFERAIEDLHANYLIILNQFYEYIKMKAVEDSCSD